MSLSDRKKLSRRFRRGVAARNRLAEKHFGLVWSVAKQLRERLPGWIDVNELISDGTIGLLRAATHYQTNPNSPFPRFAARCIRTAIIDGLRQRSAMVRTQAKASVRELAVDDQSLHRVEQIDWIGLMVRNLSSRRRQVLHMHFFEEQTMKQIGKSMGITEARVSQLVNKSLRQIRRREAA